MASTHVYISRLRAHWRLSSSARSKMCPTLPPSRQTPPHYWLTYSLPRWANTDVLCLSSHPPTWHALTHTYTLTSIDTPNLACTSHKDTQSLLTAQTQRRQKSIQTKRHSVSCSRQTAFCMSAQFSTSRVDVPTSETLWSVLPHNHTILSDLQGKYLSMRNTLRCGVTRLM